jgi:hypothetical protein
MAKITLVDEIALVLARKEDPGVDPVAVREFLHSGSSRYYDLAAEIEQVILRRRNESRDDG